MSPKGSQTTLAEDEASLRLFYPWNREAIAALIAALLLPSRFLNKCAYTFSVMPADACPRRRLIFTTSIPASMRWLA